MSIRDLTPQDAEGEIMTIEFKCPACSESIEAPDNSAGKRAKCPRCSEPLIIPEKSIAPPNPRGERKTRRGRPDGEPEPESRSRSGRKGRPDEYDDVPDPEPRSKSGRRRRPDEYGDYDDNEDDFDDPTRRRRSTKKYSEKGGPNMILVGGGIVVVLAIAAVLIFTMRDKFGKGNPENSSSPTVSSENRFLTNTPTPTQKIDLDNFLNALERVSRATSLVMESTTSKYANDIFSGGKHSIQALIEKGISNDDADVMRIADRFLAALTNQKSQIDLLYSDEADKVAEGRKFWTDWWESNKGASLADIIRPGLDPNNNDRGTLAIALGEFQDVDTVVFLFDFLGEQDMNLRTKAFSSVKRLLKNEKFNYSPDSNLEVLTTAIKEYRDWWDSVKANYDFKNPEKFLP